MQPKIPVVSMLKAESANPALDFVSAIVLKRLARATNQRAYQLTLPNHSNVPDANIARFWDDIYQNFDPTATVIGKLELPPGARPLGHRKILIVACGTGEQVVRACREAEEVTAIDISPNAIANARAIVEHHGYKANYVVGDAGRSGIAEESFDVIWGSAVLHHLMHEEVASEFARILKPGGVVYMLSEPTFFNPLLKISYELAFGKGRAGRRKRFLIFTRSGDEFEKPIEKNDLEVWRRDFDITARPRGFMFLEKVGHALSHNPAICRLFTRMDRGLVKLFPSLKKYGYEYDFIFEKKR